MGQCTRTETERPARRGAAGRSWRAASALAALALGCGAAAQDAQINIELVGPAGQVSLGQTIDVKVVLRREGLDSLLPMGNSFMALDLIFGWDPKQLELMGLSQVGAVTLLASYFPSPAADFTGINEAAPPKDGDALYYALAPIGGSVPVTEAGVLVTTLKFKVIAPFIDSVVEVIPELTVEFFADTVVYDGVVPGLDVTGSFTDAVVHQLEPCPQDLDASGTVDGGDLGTLLGMWGEGEAPADFNDDGRVDGNDLGSLLGAWGICSASGAED